MSVLAHVLERAGLATVGISIVRQQAVNAKPPRMLHCDFPLGRPLGRPNDVELPTDVITAAFALLARTDVPVLADYPLAIEDESDTPAACPLPPRHDPDVPAAVDEARGLRRAYDRSVATYGRTAVGRIADADGIPGLIETMIRIEGGESLDDVGWDAAALHSAGQDIRAYYEEAGLGLADVTGARRLESWLYQTTAVGALLRSTQRVLKAAGVDRNTWYYLLPRTQPR